MRIEIKNLGHRFKDRYLFKDLNVTFSNGGHYAITGRNGSGKSTLIKIIAGYLHPLKGEVNYLIENEPIAVEDVFKRISICSPHLELVEDFNIEEFLEFHFSLRTGIHKNVKMEIIETLKFSNQKSIADYSSGMRQRLKLLTAFYTSSNLLLLDEPTSNFDKQGIDLYLSLIDQTDKNRTVIIASNKELEYKHCTELIPLG